MVFHEEFYPYHVDAYSPIVLEGGTIVLIKQHSDYVPLEDPSFTNFTHTSKHINPCASPCRPQCVSPCKPVCPPKRPPCQAPYCPIYRPQHSSPCIYPYPCRSSCVPIYGRPQYPIHYRPICQNPYQQSCYPPCGYPRPQICVQPRCQYPQYPYCPPCGYPRGSQCVQPCPYEYLEFYLF